MKTSRESLVAILGMSDKPQRYSFRAHQKLLSNGFANQIGISPKNMELERITLCHSLDEIKEKVHTLTLYVGPNIPSIHEALLLLPQFRVINHYISRLVI